MPIARAKRADKRKCLRGYVKRGREVFVLECGGLDTAVVFLLESAHLAGASCCVEGTLECVVDPKNWTADEATVRRSRERGKQ
jgi:hypothetical protein